MGLSASQARLLNLTARMHDIEYKAQNLEAQKLQMANESTHVYQEYEDALNRQKVQLKHIAADGSAQYRDAGVADLIAAGYRIKILDGSVWNELNAKGDKIGTFKTTATPNIDTSGHNVGDVITVDSKDYKVATVGTSGSGYEFEESKKDEIKNLISSTDVETLRNLVEAGFIVFEKPEYRNGSLVGYTETNIATDTNLQEVTDPVDLKKAEAKYEADMRKIDAKDKKFDTDIAAMETERNAIKQEMETLKTVAKDNVDRTFKLFS